MSGGVDSSVSLLLLKKWGWQPIGLSMKFASWNGKENVCSTDTSLKKAQEVCKSVGVEHFTVDCAKEFEQKTISYFNQMIKEKKTPNPCVLCNQELKFKKLAEWADQKNIEHIATGHYVRVKKKNSHFELLRGKDKNKDQSYFLCLLTQDLLKRLVFPLGDFKKEEVYQIAQENGLKDYENIRQSQDLCFLNGQSISDYLQKEFGLQKGPILDTYGNEMGQHDGLHFYTIGQRKRINLPHGPWWVVDFDLSKNALIVTNQEDDPKLFHQTVIVKNPHFISKAPIKKTSVEAKVRYNQEPQKADLYPPEEDILNLFFKEKQKAITPGQWAVFYKKEVCLGGGVINNFK